MHDVRPPAVAGLFYAGDKAALEQQLSDSYADAAPPEPMPRTPRALIVPHAGYIYSGAIAASAYQSLQNLSGIKRIVLFGPTHRVGFRGIAYSTSSAWETPLGTVPVDTASCHQLDLFNFVVPLEEAFAQEHCLEVQLPFLQQRLHNFSIVPLLAGQCTTEQAALVLETLWSPEDTLIVISSDLSHYHDYATAQRLDGDTAQHILALDTAFPPDQACGQRAVKGLMLMAHEMGLKPVQLDLRNSGDTAGSHDRVVGYGAFAFI